MSNNNWQEDHQFGTEEYQPLLDTSFYPHIAPHMTKPEQIRRFDSKSYHDVVRQRFKMDLEVELPPYVWFDIEEKIVRWPHDGKPHTAFYYETESCSLPEFITQDGCKTVKPNVSCMPLKSLDAVSISISRNNSRR